MPTWVLQILGASGVVGTILVGWWAAKTSLATMLFARIALLEGRLAAQDQAFLTLSSELIRVQKENLNMQQENFHLRERLQMLETGKLEVSQGA